MRTVQPSGTASTATLPPTLSASPTALHPDVRAQVEADLATPSLDRLIAALPDAVDESMRKAIPHRYTPELAAKFTAAMIAELRNPQTIEPGHYPWCETTECTSHRYDDGEVLTEHLGAKLMMPVPEGLDCYANELLYAQLGTDENLVDPTPTVSFNSGGNGVLLDADGLDKVIGDLTQFTDGLRAMRQQMTAEKTGAQA
ncbi:DUF6907 domain-containing protein [Streptomyces sp. AK08-02]|uniref:DUF6907 domain-containing protein n=1 Tax=Streptomyces sp. AK08-02 TaxID=3028654 RepID=UPI0029A2C01B|nr:hypothetical protein [Streptomyces sp. AK08-02]MDX3747487.1 hypothetical protein [Streptomyces sp. AK08-02]